MPESARRLAAIMFTDLVGFTSLSQRDESLALSVLDEQRRLLRPMFNKHGGREVKTIGDAFLIDFPSALSAVKCAYEIQKTTRDINSSFPEARRVWLRIGVHLGDVVESEGDISGDAVNVASRIESLADSGGVCLTRQVYDQVHNKFEMSLVNLGAKQLKNVNAPTEIFKMVMPWEEQVRGYSDELDARRIVVLPFVNMSPDPNDAYFADGVTDEIISIASNVSGMSVISRTSAMGYKGTTKNVKEIGRELGVGSVLEGSFKKAGNKIRITAQLINTSNDSHVWAQSYDRDLDDVFAVQTDIATQVADSLKARILPGERQRIEKPPTSNTDAYSLYLKGRHFWNERTEKSVRTALIYFEKAAERDPNFALALVGIADCYGVLVGHGYVTPLEGLANAKDYLTKALEIDEGLGEAHATLGNILHLQWNWSEAQREFERSLELSPGYATAHHRYSALLATRGRIQEALAEIEKARQLDPNSLIILTAKSSYFYFARDYDKSIEVGEKVLEMDPNFLPGILNIFASYIAEKRLVEAEALIPKGVNVVLKGLGLIPKGSGLIPRSMTRVLRRMGLIPRGMGLLAHAYGKLGKLAETRKTLAEAERADEREYTFALHIAMAHYYLGETELTFKWLDRAVAQKDPGLIFLKVDPEYDPLRGNPKFVDLLKKVGLD